MTFQRSRLLQPVIRELHCEAGAIVSGKLCAGSYLILPGGVERFVNCTV